MEPIQLQIASDIHFEHRFFPYEHIINPVGNVLALLGDIDSVFSSNLPKFLKWCKSRFNHVLYVPGNHEFYSPSTTKPVTITEITQKLKDMCDQIGVTLLQNSHVDIGDVRFIGSTLWSYVPHEYKELVKAHLNDYRLIFKTPNKCIDVNDTVAEYCKSRDYITKTIANTKNKKIVVLTHHAPSLYKTSSPKYALKPTTTGFASHLPYTPGIIRLWCSGHTHYNFHHSVQGYELISNQFGYFDNPIRGYKSDLVITI
jgi:hypothetical protein